MNNSYKYYVKCSLEAWNIKPQIGIRKLKMRGIY